MPLTTTSTPIGELLLIATPSGLARLAFDNDDWPSVITSAEARLTAPGTPEDDRQALAHLGRAVDELSAYFNGELRSFGVALDLVLARGFRRLVAEHLRTIPFGHTESYSQVARAVDNPKAVRAVGSACSHNPIPIFVPCHRVLTSDGRIGGYLGGTGAKEYLLHLEGIDL